MPDDYSALFYHRLFERHPFTRALFPDDMAKQVSTFRNTVDTLIAAINDLPALRDALVDLGRRHIRYGATRQHYRFVGEVLIDTFAEMLGSDFKTETRSAWDTLYRDTAEMMRRTA